MTSAKTEVQGYHANKERERETEKDTHTKRKRTLLPTGSARTTEPKAHQKHHKQRHYRFSKGKGDEKECRKEFRGSSAPKKVHQKRDYLGETLVSTRWTRNSAKTITRKCVLCLCRFLLVPVA